MVKNPFDLLNITGGEGWGNWIGSQLDALTGKAQMDIAQMNYEEQKRHNLAMEDFSRNARSIAAEDLKRAGLPIQLAAGSPAAAPRINAPQKSEAGAAARGEFLRRSLQAPLNIAQMYYGMQNVQAQTAKTLAEADFLKVRSAGQGYSNEVMRDTLQYAKNKIMYESSISAYRSQLENFKAKMSGLQWAIYKDFITELGGDVSAQKENGSFSVKFPEGKNPQLLEYQALLATYNLTEARASIEGATADLFGEDSLLGGGSKGWQIFMRAVTEILKGRMP